MSLDFSVERMKNYKVLTTLVIPAFEKGGATGCFYPEQTNWHPVTDALIWATMPVGISRITEANWKDFYDRLHMKELVMGPSLYRAESSSDPKNFITPLEVYMHIGLSTNASSKTQAQFLKDLFAHVAKNSTDSAKKAPELYESLGLEQMTEEAYQAAQRVDDRKDLDTLDVMLERYQKTGTSSTNPMITDENIISTSVD